MPACALCPRQDLKLAPTAEPREGLLTQCCVQALRPYFMGLDWGSAFPAGVQVTLRLPVLGPRFKKHCSETAGSVHMHSQLAAAQHPSFSMTSSQSDQHTGLGNRAASVVLGSLGRRIPAGKPKAQTSQVVPTGLPGGPTSMAVNPPQVISAHSRMASQ